MKHNEAQDSLAVWLRSRYVSRPLIFTEIALAGKNGRQGRLDVVAVWTTGQYRNNVVHGYEVKVSRSDLLRDLKSEKWRRYLTQVDRLFFAFPKDVASPDEVPPEAGVIVHNGVGWQQVRAAKPQKREPDPSLPWRLLWRAHAEVNEERVERRRLQTKLRDRARSR